MIYRKMEFRHRVLALFVGSQLPGIAAYRLPLFRKSGSAPAVSNSLLRTTFGGALAVCFRVMNSKCHNRVTKLRYVTDQWVLLTELSISHKICIRRKNRVAVCRPVVRRSCATGARRRVYT